MCHLPHTDVAHAYYFCLGWSANPNNINHNLQLQPVIWRIRLANYIPFHCQQITRKSQKLKGADPTARQSKSDVSCSCVHRAPLFLNRIKSTSTRHRVALGDTLIHYSGYSVCKIFWVNPTYTNPGLQIHWFEYKINVLFKKHFSNSVPSRYLWPIVTC